jgi:hypothetical protein
LSGRRRSHYTSHARAPSRSKFVQKSFALVVADLNETSRFLTKCSTAIFSGGQNAISYSRSRGLRVSQADFDQPLRLRKKDEKKVKAFKRARSATEMMCDNGVVSLVHPPGRQRRGVGHMSRQPLRASSHGPRGAYYGHHLLFDGVAGKLRRLHDLILPLLVRSR